jgi:hypothetical protein
MMFNSESLYPYWIEAHSHTADRIRGFLSQEGINIKALEQSSQLVLLKESEAYTKKGSLDPDKMTSFLAIETQRTIAEGYTVLRLTGEMT